MSYLNDQNRAMAEHLETAKPFPAEWAGTYPLDKAYDAQLDTLHHRKTMGHKHVGWKVGLTSVAMQKQQGVLEPCMGYLLERGHLTSGASLPMSGLVAPGFENELCLRLKHPLSGKNITFDEATAAIDAVAPALEIVEKRANFGADFAFAIAGNVQQRAFVTSDFQHFDQMTDLAEIEAHVHINGSLAETAKGAEVLGNPIHSVIWLADMLSRYDLQLHPGDLIMSGSFTSQYTAKPGDHVLTRFEGIGEVAFTFQDA